MSFFPTQRLQQIVFSPKMAATLSPIPCVHTPDRSLLPHHAAHEPLLKVRLKVQKMKMHRTAQKTNYTEIQDSKYFLRTNFGYNAWGSLLITSSNNKSNNHCYFEIHYHITVVEDM